LKTKFVDGKHFIAELFLDVKRMWELIEILEHANLDSVIDRLLVLVIDSMSFHSSIVMIKNGNIEDIVEYNHYHGNLAKIMQEFSFD
jgi:hypothetical protein